MSLRLAIPRRVGLHQSPPPLRQPTVSLRKRNRFEKYNPFNGECSYRKMSHGRGPPHGIVVNIVAARCHQDHRRTLAFHTRRYQRALPLMRSTSRVLFRSLRSPGETVTVRLPDHRVATFCQFGFNDLPVRLAGARRRDPAWLPRRFFGRRVGGHLYGRVAEFRPHPPGGRTAIPAARRYAPAVASTVCLSKGRSPSMRFQQSAIPWQHFLQVDAGKQIEPLTASAGENPES
jgi:hypothetical protein